MTLRLMDKPRGGYAIFKGKDEEIDKLLERRKTGNTSQWPRHTDVPTEYLIRVRYECDAAGAVDLREIAILSKGNDGKKDTWMLLMDSETGRYGDKQHGGGVLVRYFLGRRALPMVVGRLERVEEHAKARGSLKRMVKAGPKSVAEEDPKERDDDFNFDAVDDDGEE